MALYPLSPNGSLMREPDPTPQAPTPEDLARQIVEARHRYFEQRNSKFGTLYGCQEAEREWTALLLAHGSNIAEVYLILCASVARLDAANPEHLSVWLTNMLREPQPAVSAPTPEDLVRFQALRDKVREQIESAKPFGVTSSFNAAAQFFRLDHLLDEADAVQRAYIELRARAQPWGDEPWDEYLSRQREKANALQLDLATARENFQQAARDADAAGKNATYWLGEAEAWRERAERTTALNTNQRLFDLVRSQRQNLLEAGLIDESEYAELAFAESTGERFRDYDEVRAEIATAEQRGYDRRQTEIIEALKEAGGSIRLDWGPQTHGIIELHNERAEIIEAQLRMIPATEDVPPPVLMGDSDMVFGRFWNGNYVICFYRHSTKTWHEFDDDRPPLHITAWRHFLPSDAK